MTSENPSLEVLNNLLGLYFVNSHSLYIDNSKTYKTLQKFLNIILKNYYLEISKDLGVSITDTGLPVQYYSSKFKEALINLKALPLKTHFHVKHLYAILLAVFLVLLCTDKVHDVINPSSRSKNLRIFALPACVRELVEIFSLTIQDNFKCSTSLNWEKLKKVITAIKLYF
jgi:hypothetical protein